MSKNEYNLIKELLKLSCNKEWSKAKLEWSFQEAYINEEKQTCLCGHFPIIEICIIYNKYTNSYAEIGNKCVKKFIGLEEQDNIFKSICRISKNISKKVDLYTLNYVFNKKWISQEDYDFYTDILKKRKLSDKQIKWKQDINRRIIYGIRRNKNKQVLKYDSK